MRRLPLLAIFLLFLALILMPSAHAIQDAPFDLVLRNGKIVDGTGNPWYYGDLAVQGDKIVALGKITAKGKREIDAKGLIVAPGFVDMHSHSDYTILEDGKAMSKITQGVTTEVLGEIARPARSRADCRRSNARQWPTHAMDHARRLLRYRGQNQSVVQHRFLRRPRHRVEMRHGQLARPAHQGAIRKDQMLVEEAMQNGARGLSCMLAAPPGSLATTDEIVELCKVVKRYNGIFCVHNRHEGTNIFEAIREVIEIGRRAGITVEILHIKIADQHFWGRMSEVVQPIDDARKSGVNVRPTFIPTRAATTTWRPSYRPGLTKAAPRKCSNA